MRWTNISDTDVFDVDELDASTSPPTGSPTSRERARRDAGEHPVHHRPGERVTVGEVPVRLDRQLVLVVGRRIRGRRTATRRPPNVIDPSSWP